jgi:hypothetical protein
VTLHDLENALSELVATMFWTSKFPLQSNVLSTLNPPILKVNHIPPTHQIDEIRVDLLPGVNGIFMEYGLSEIENPLVFLPGENTTATEQFIRIQLNLS